MFLLNSRPDRFTVTLRTPSVRLHPLGTPFPEVTGPFVPSSLRRVISSALPKYGYLPVSDYGTIDYRTRLMDFLGSLALMTSSLTYRRLRITPHTTLSDSAIGLHTDIQHCAHLASCVPIKLVTFIVSSGILTGYPSITPFGLTLGSTNPGRINLPQETLDFRRYGFSP